MYDGEMNHFGFSPNITYKGDNQIVNMTDIDDFSNNQQETVNTMATATNSFTGSNDFSSTVIPIVLNGDGEYSSIHVTKACQKDCRAHFKARSC